MNLNDLEHIYFCTGARNCILLDHFPENKITFEIDERIASFKALGRTKINQTPVAICTTSGTAVSECLSAMIEASYSNLPLVLITGDRPLALRGTGAPQTVDHELITRGFRGEYLELTLKEFTTFNFNLLDRAFPLHINVLVGEDAQDEPRFLIREDYQSLSRFLENKIQPLFLISHESRSMRPVVEKFSEQKVLFYAESLSHGHDLSPIKTESELLKLFKHDYFDCVVRIGLPGLSHGEVLKKSADSLLAEATFWESLKIFSHSRYIDQSTKLLSRLIKQYPEAEVSWMEKIHDALPSNAMVFLGNSLVMRNFELVQTKAFKVYGNRGVNGIDGQIATAIGLANSGPDNVYAILGDLTTFYDLSCLMNFPSNLKIIVINNDGGRIFDVLKLNPKMILEHGRSFSAIAECFKLRYCLNNLNQLSECDFIEVTPDLNQSHGFVSEWQA
jgi:2-succinyl-5-enolpyruvyl-6-hydroxy-3-cyclohexene-1-carboxylate synthase